MTANEIIRAANVGRLATADMDLPTVLAREVMQSFMLDIGDVRWRQKVKTLAVVVPTRTYDLPEDFFYMVGIYRPLTGTANLTPEEFKYIGEDPIHVAASELATQAGTPYAYYFTDHSSDGRHQGAVKFDVPPSEAMTVPYIYLPFPLFRSVTEDHDLSRWIPEPLQYGLVYGLKRVIFMERYGRGDQRYDKADEQYKEWIERAKEWRDVARRNYVARMV